jgi:nicotinamide-nucleotide amidase
VTTLSRAAIIAVGSELLMTTRVDTNSLFITEQLNSLGIEVLFKIVAGDDRDELAHALRSALARVELVVCTGGLGPTDDDVTRDAVAAVLGRRLVEDAAIVERLRARFAGRGLAMPEINRRQAMVPDGARVLENAVGTAPGLWLEADGRVVALLPGPPREMKPMLGGLAAGPLRERAGGVPLRRRVVRITGRGESHAEEALRPLYAAWAVGAIPIGATILAAMGQLELHLSARAPTTSAADAALDQAVAGVQQVLGRDVYSTDGSPIEAVLGALLVERSLRLAVAESCTGGLVTSRLTDIPGSSRYVLQSVVAYANEAKVAMLGVPQETLDRFGAVSEETARAMADGIRARAGSDLGIGVTGIAGPDGGSPEKPVGTVAVALAGLGATRSRMFRFVGDRDLVKFQASQAALDMVRRGLLGP